DFEPGQFVLVETDPEIEMYRAYTISGSSSDQSEVSITIKLLNDGYGTNLLFNNLVERTEIKLKGPLGNELKVDPQGKELLFLANGIGITPFVSTVQSFFERKDKGFEGKATLLYGARYEEDLVYDDYLTNAAENNEHFNYHRLLSKPRTDNYRKGYVTELLEELDPPDYTKVYICGTAEMATDAREILVSKGITEDNIYYECFL
ncbi:MAG: ferredoxin--NADP reductase, partial [Bacillota bacterium]